MPGVRMLASFTLLVLLGCATNPLAVLRLQVSDDLVNRTGYSLNAPGSPNTLYLPNGATFASGLREEEAILIALWNNPAFGELLADLNIARGDLIQAGLLPNPEVVYFFSVPNKPFKYALELPIEAFWLRPIREAAAARESARVGLRVTQAALDLIRDVRLTYFDILLARARARVAQQGVELREGIAKVAEIRLKEGDISEQEAATARIEYQQAQQLFARVQYDSTLVEERLRWLLGLTTQRDPLYLWSNPLPLFVDQEIDALVNEAAISRPDVLSAEEAFLAAYHRLHLAQTGWFRFLGIADATSGRATGHEFGPSLRLTLPIFNWNEGNVARAEAEVEKADRNRTTVRNQAMLDVRLAATRYTRARAEWQVLVGQVRPAVEAAIRQVRTAYAEGNTPYVVILETTRQLLDTHLREAELHAELRLSCAELERSLGRRLTLSTLPQPPEKSQKSGTEEGSRDMLPERSPEPLKEKPVEVPLPPGAP